MPDERGWYSRGYLPHFDAPEVIQHVTFHLADSLPAAARERLDTELRSVPSPRRDAERRKRLDAWIDSGHGSCLLRTPSAAKLVQEAILSFNTTRYRLFAWVVMPNHVHVLFQPLPGWTTGRIVTSWKSYTGRRLSPLLTRQSTDPRLPRRVWHREYWDRFIRDERHFRATVDYIHNNPLKAGLVSHPEEWPWSSAYADPPLG